MDKEQVSQINCWWEKLQPLVRKFVRQTFIAGFDDEDLRQECFLLLQKAMQRYDASSGISFAYYYKVVLCGWRANENKKKRECETSCQEEQIIFLADERIDTEVDIEKEIERKMLIEQIKQHIGFLEKVERQIILAYYFENKKLKELALELGLTYKQLEYKKKGALEQLRRSL